MAKSNKFGTFGGVFTPSILTILGVIMYMRLPMIVGEAGLFATIGIVVVAHLISVTTGLSVSTIATDKKVQAGGTYYMISRSLGLPIGGTLGLALFVGLSFSVSLYLIGFSESFLNFWGLDVSKDTIRITGSITLLAVTIITFISTSLALKTQYFIMAAIVLSLVSIILGKHEFVPEVPTLANPSNAIPLMVLFGIFFPAVTGFEAGVSMSGDLKDPKKSIPMGTISAITVGFIVYILLTIYFSYTVDPKVLASDPKVLLNISRVPQLVIAGIWGATLSSALGSILGAPRILQATATDRISPAIFSKGTGRTNEPRNALLLTFVIAEAGILIGELNVIARVVSIFFITTYGFLNLSCFFERLTSADFRPAFKAPAWISLLGAAACIIVMIQLDFVAMLGAIVILGLLFLYLKRKELVLQSGDAWSSIWASLVKTGLFKLKKEKIQSRNWRPNIIMFSGDEKERGYLIELGKDLSGRLGILTAFDLKESSEEILPANQNLLKISEAESGFFIKQHFCHDVYSGMNEIIRVFGFSGVEPNTILMGWSKKEKNKTQFINLVKSFIRNNYNSIFLGYDPQKGFGDRKSIDIWWSGWGQNLTFAINMIRHLTSSPKWKDVKIRIFVITSDSSTSEIIYRSIENVMEQYRVHMDVKVINNSVEKRSRNELIHKESQNTDLTIVGIPDKKFQQIEQSFNEISQITKNPGSILIINASSGFESHDLIITDKELAKPAGMVKGITILPEIQFTNFPIVNSEISKIDHEQRNLHKLLNDKALNPFMVHNTSMVQVISNQIKGLDAYFEKLPLLPEKYRRIKQLIKIKNDFYFQTRRLLLRIINETSTNQKEVLETGITWLTHYLSEYFSAFPKSIKLSYNKTEYAIQKGDSFRVRWFKHRKKIMHPFAKSSIANTIAFRKAIVFYFHDEFLVSLNSILDNITFNGLWLIQKVEGFFVSLENDWEALQKDILSGVEDPKALKKYSEKQIIELNKLEKIYNDRHESLISRISFEMRERLNIFSKNIMQVNFNHWVRKSRRKRKFYLQTLEKNNALAGIWFDLAQQIYSGVLLSLTLSSVKNRLKNETEAFLLIIKQQIDQGFIKKVEKYISEIQDVKKINLDEPFSAGLIFEKHLLKYEESFSLLNEKISEMTEELPEEITITETTINDISSVFQDEFSGSQIPLRRLARHFIDSLFLGQLEKYIYTLRKDLETSSYIIKDQISYMHFGLENIESSMEDKQTASIKIIDETVVKITSEEAKIIKKKDAIQTDVDQLIDQSLDGLSLHKIVDNTKELAHLIREYQGQKTKGRMDSLVERIEKSLRKGILRLLYSQSEGILLAKELTENEEELSLPGRMLEMVNKLSPDGKVYDALPLHYKNLFSGRSTIGEDFWIERKHEEQNFKIALNNYKSGYHGGIMVLGDRNAGKTTFCKNITKRYFNPEKVFHIFPPVEGSIQISDLNKVLNATTSLHGNNTDVFNKLQRQSVIIFHDLELWWESSENGLVVIHTILDLIKKFGSKFLFIVNMNVYTYNKLNQFIDLENRFISIIHCKPFDSEELKELVMKRHRAGGLSLSLGKKPREHLSEIKLAALFNKLFNFSNGNPGHTLYAWLSCITNTTINKLFITPPEIPKFTVLEHLNDDWQVFIIQFILHKRMNMNKLERVLHIDKSKIEKTIEAFQLSGLIKEKTSGVYIINPYIDNYLINYFHKQSLI